MSRSFTRSSFLRRASAAAVAVAGIALATSCGGRADAAAVPLPDPVVDQAAPPAAGEQVAVLSGGCFWGIQLVYEHVKGVTSATSGYAGGEASTASYGEVSTGSTGHAESVRITFDPSQISYGQILRVFFSVAHDPTELNRQGPDVGTQYRSAIWTTSPEQEKVARAYIDQLTKAHRFSRPIVTTVAPLPGFYPAEKYHQDYALHNPGDPYIMINDQPKLGRLQALLPDLYRESPATYAAAR